MHPCSPWRTSVSSSSFYLFPFFFSRTFFRLLLTQLDIETEHIRKKKNALGEYSIALAKRGHSDCWLRCARHNRSLANGVNCVLRAMRDEKDKVVFFFCCLMDLVCFLHFFFLLKASDWWWTCLEFCCFLSSCSSRIFSLSGQAS